MITNITLENFKCFRQVSINPKLLTVLIGPNGTGKSGVLQALTLVRQSKDASKALDLQGPLLHMHLEDFMFHGLDIERNTVGLSLSGSRGVVSDGIRSDVQFGIGFSYGKDAKVRSVKDSSTSTLVNYRGSEFRFPLADPRQEDRIVNGDYFILYSRGQGLNVIEDARAYVGHNPIQANSEPILNRLLREASSIPSQVVADIKVVPLMRGLTQQVYPLGPKIVDELSSVNGLSKQEADTVTSLGYLQPYVAKVSDMLNRVTGVGFKVDLTQPVSIVPRSYSDKVGQVGLVSEGFGTNGLIQLFFELARSPSGTTVLIEEPEIHLHPKAQAELAEVLADTAKAEDKQIIMTTHSEHLVERLLLLVAEGSLSPDDLAIYSFAKDEKGECSATEIVVTDNGQVEGGLTDFYANNLDTLDRRVKALKRSK